jgi:hypothetical protein
MDGTILHMATDAQIDTHDDDVGIVYAVDMETIDERCSADMKMARVRALLLHAEVTGGDNPSEVLRQLQSVVGGVGADDDEQMSDAARDVQEWDESIVDEVDADKTTNARHREDGKNRMSTRMFVFSDVQCGDGVVNFGGANEQETNTNDVQGEDVAEQVDREVAALMTYLLGVVDS